MTVYCYAATRNAIVKSACLHAAMSDSSDENYSVDAFSDHVRDHLSCSSYSSDEESDIEGTDEAQEILPYQFEPEYTEEEILQLEAAGQGHGGGVEDRQQNTDW